VFMDQRIIIADRAVLCCRLGVHLSTSCVDDRPARW
jgi:hypothetical protein